MYKNTKILTIVQSKTEMYLSFQAKASIRLVSTAKCSVYCEDGCIPPRSSFQCAFPLPGHNHSNVRIIYKSGAGSNFSAFGIIFAIKTF